MGGTLPTVEAALIVTPDSCPSPRFAALAPLRRPWPPFAALGPPWPRPSALPRVEGALLHAYTPAAVVPGEEGGCCAAAAAAAAGVAAGVAVVVAVASRRVSPQRASRRVLGVGRWKEEACEGGIVDGGSPTPPPLASRGPGAGSGKPSAQQASAHRE